MFSLIITIISIALVAALALATLYFGGDAFNQGSAKAAASTIVNQASQISGANTLYFLDNQAYAAVVDSVSADLVTDYLASMPNPGTAGNTWDVVGGTDSLIALDGVAQAVCEAINVQADLALTLDGTADTVADVTTQFGCYESAVGAFTFVFK